MTKTTSLRAPFPWFGGKSRAAPEVWAAFGLVDNYVEPFCGSAAMLLSAPDGERVETINDADGFVANFWRAVRADPDVVAWWADYPVSEADLEARHGWLVNRADRLRWQLEDPDFFDPKIAGWWCWGLCIWIGDCWCSGKGPHQHNGVSLRDRRNFPASDGGAAGVKRQLPNLSDDRGINRQLPHLSDGRGINLQLPHDGGRGEVIREWMGALSARLRDVRIACGDWRRVLTDSVTVRHGDTAIFMDPPYTLGDIDYSAHGTGGEMADAARAWCLENGARSGMRIVLCGHAGDHDELLAHGWSTRTWANRTGYAKTAEAKARAKRELLWCSPHCIPDADQAQQAMAFDSPTTEGLDHAPI